MVYLYIRTGSGANAKYEKIRFETYNAALKYSAEHQNKIVREFKEKYPAYSCYVFPNNTVNDVMLFDTVDKSVIKSFGYSIFSD